MVDTCVVNVTNINVLRFSDNTCLFFFNDTATTEIYTLSLHDALPILRPADESRLRDKLMEKEDNKSASRTPIKDIKPVDKEFIESVW